MFERSAAKKRVPVCPVCDSKSNVKCSAELFSAVTFSCEKSSCIEHHRSIGDYPHFMAPAPKGKAPNCPKCGHSKYVGESYIHKGLFVCHKHTSDNCIGVDEPYGYAVCG